MKINDFSPVFTVVLSSHTPPMKSLWHLSGSAVLASPHKAGSQGDLVPSTPAWRWRRLHFPPSWYHHPSLGSFLYLLPLLPFAHRAGIGLGDG